MHEIFQVQTMLLLQVQVANLGMDDDVRDGILLHLFKRLIRHDSKIINRKRHFRAIIGDGRC
jgi:hypothetical protein